MSSNQAFTKKLRTAIKTKIQEYGVDADAELPDYVMVLAANRKEKNQMKADLNLFLGKHTTSFVEWLFDAFDKIQKVEAEHTESKSSSKKSSSNAEEKKSSKNEPTSTKDFHTDSKKSSGKPESDRRSKRSRSIQSIESLSPQPTRLKSKVVVVEAKRHTSPKHRESRRDERTRSTTQQSSSRHDERSRSRTSRNEDYPEKKRSNEERSRRKSPELRTRQVERSRSREKKPVSISDSEDEQANNKTKQPATKRIASPKIHYDDMPSSSNNGSQNNDKELKREILMVGQQNEEKVNAPRRFIVRFGNKQICRKVSPNRRDSVTKTDKDKNVAESNTQNIRKRRSDDPMRVVSKILNSQELKITSRRERFENENAKKAKVDESKKKEDDYVEPYSPVPVKNESDEERKIDEFLSTVQSQVVHQPTTIAPQYVPNQTYYPRMAFERCLFWPNCAKGNDCPYHHPSQLCSKFPNCTYGSQCLNIHPMCRFDGRCAKFRCPYTHNKAKKNASASVQSTYQRPDLSQYQWRAEH